MAAIWQVVERPDRARRRQLLISLKALIVLYLAFAAKHFICDYLLQTGWMARGKAGRCDWVRPLFAHAGLHALGTGVIVLLVNPAFWWLAPLDLCIHAGIDRGKALAAAGYTPDKAMFWKAFGLDQLAHQLTHFAYVVTILAS